MSGAVRADYWLRTYSDGWTITRWYVNGVRVSWKAKRTYTPPSRRGLTFP